MSRSKIIRILVVKHSSIECESFKNVNGSRKLLKRVSCHLAIVVCHGTLACRRLDLQYCKMIVETPRSILDARVRHDLGCDLYAVIRHFENAMV